MNIPDTLPPHDDQAEAGALACILNADGEAADLLGQLESEHFYDARHQQILTALRAVQHAGKPLNFIELRQWLKDRDLIEGAGGELYLSALPDQTPSPANW